MLSAKFKQVRTDGWNLAGPPDLIQAIRADAAATGTNLNEYLHASRILASHILYARSIDEFVDHHQDNRLIVLLAKMGICSAILEHERSSNLFGKDQAQRLQVKHDFLDKNDVWLKQLWYMMRQEVPRTRPAALFENLSFVNFNYDRTLEAFLTQALVDMYEMEADEASRLIENCPIYHPYGAVDRLLSTPFGGRENLELLSLKDNIRTYTESEESPQKAEYETHLSNAANLVFLGFAYRRLNLELLSANRRHSLAIYGTAVGVPEENYISIESRLNGVLQPSNGVLHVRFRDVKSAELLRLYEEPLIG